MGAGGEATKDEAPAADHRYDLRRRKEFVNSSTTTPQKGKGKGKGKPTMRRTGSLEKITKLADWKNIGLHKKYADETMVWISQVGVAGRGGDLPCMCSTRGNKLDDIFCGKETFFFFSVLDTMGRISCFFHHPLYR